MCISREHYNLCECGCPEIVHEEVFDILRMLDPFGFADPFGMKDPFGFNPFGQTLRGKCCGEIPLLLSVEEVKQMVEEAKARGETKIKITKPCDCKKFDPIFKPMCTGFGA
jgi:hypothetical protein